MAESRTLAIPLRLIDFSETSQVVRFLTRDSGKITAIARGAKRLKGSFPGPFDLFIEYETVRLSKGQERLEVLIGASIRRAFPVFRHDLARLYAASYATELTDDLTPEAQPAVAVYDLYAGFLESLQAGGPVELDLFRFEGRLLHERGFFPRLLECGGCRSRIAQADAWFSPRDGGSICLRCRTHDPGAFRVTTRTLYAAAHLLSAEPLPAEHYRRVAAELRRLLDEHIRHVAERSPRSARFAREVCVPTTRPAPRREPPPRPAPRPSAPPPRAAGGPASRGS
jgi:DNA repair protein RecO (recombination protein O)